MAPPKYFIFPNPSQPPIGLQPDYKWTNNYIAGAGGVQTLVADIGGVDFTQTTATNQPQDTGNKLTFDGIDDWMDSGTGTFGTHDLFCGAGRSFTIFHRFKLSDTSNSALFSMSNISGGNDLALYIINGTNLKLVCRGTISDISTIPANTDTTVALVWDGTQLLSYIDGVLPSVEVVGTGSEVTGATLKLALRSTSFPLTGDIYEARIYNQALNADQVLEAYNEMNPQPTPDYKWTNNYIAGAGGVQTLVADIGGVDFTQATAANQPQDTGNKLTFDGNNDYMEALITDTQVLDTEGVAGEMTMTVKVDTTANRSFQFIAGAREGGNPERLYFMRNNTTDPGKFTFGHFDSFPETNVVNDNVTLTTVISNGQASSYVDGIQIASSTITQTSGSGSNFKLGAVGAAAIEFDGSIHEFRIYTQALNADQVLEAYNEMNP